MDRSPLEQFLGQQVGAFKLESPVTVTPATSVRQAVGHMRGNGHSCVITMDGDTLTGVFTERDVLLSCMEDGFDWDQPVQAVGAHQPPRTIPTSATIADAVALMHQTQYRTLPVTTSGGGISGVVRLGDILTALAECYPETVLNLPPRPHQVMEKPEGG
jgi:CBS domain-containing protein